MSHFRYPLISLLAPRVFNPHFFLCAAFVQDQLAYAHVAPEVTGVPEVTKEQVVEAADSASYIEDEKKSPHGAHQQVEETDIPVGDGRLPTDEELETLVRVPAPVPIRAFAVAVCELAERFSYYGCSNAFTNFIQQPRPPYNVGGWTGANRTSGGVTGALGKGQKAAYGLVTFLSFWMYATPIPGSIIADSYLGRYNTIIIALIIATIGHILLIICSIPQVMDNVQGAYACMIIALVVMGIGTGFFKSNIGPLICEQVPTNHMFVSTDKKGQKVLVDPGLTISNIFMFFYWMINIGAITGQVGMSFAESEYHILVPYATLRPKHNCTDCLDTDSIFPHYDLSLIHLPYFILISIFSLGSYSVTASQSMLAL